MLRTKKCRIELLVAFTVLLLLVFTLPAMAAQGNHELIKPNQLMGLINSNNVVVIDVRSAAEYQAGHIPGAVRVSENEFYEDVHVTVGESQKLVKKMVANPEKIAEMLSRIGVKPQTHVVVYSKSSATKIATRLWWTLEMYGHSKVQVLDGGYEAWKAATDKISTDDVDPIRSFYPASKLAMDPSFIATYEEVLDALEQGVIVIDCRDWKQFNTSHIPDTFLIPEEDMFNPDKTFKSKQELRSYFAGYGITGKTPVITYCNSGTTSTVQYFALTQVLGCKDVQNYDGSMNEWSVRVTE